MCPTTTAQEAYTDVVELCALLQCLGFSVKSLNTSEENVSQETGARTVIINCQASGLHVVLESGCSTCSCPPEASQHNSGVWHVSGIAGGQRLDKEFGRSILRSLLKAHRERLSKELRVMMRCIRESGESDAEKSKEKANKSVSMVEVKVSPERRNSLVKAETPTRYRSLDTLTAEKEDQQLPTPGLLQKKLLLADTSTEEVANNYNKKVMCRRQSTYTLSPPGSVKIRNETSRNSLVKAETPTRNRSLDTLTAEKEDQQLLTPGLLQKKLLLADTSTEEVANNYNKKVMCRRQSTYTLSPPGSVKIRNETSSSLQQPRGAVLESLMDAEKAAEALRHELAAIIKQLADEGKDDSSMSSLALDVSKISLLKGSEPLKAQFASSPNLSGLGTVYEDMKKNKLLGLDAAYSSLGPKKTPNNDSGVASISPNFFKSKSSSSSKNDKLKPQDSKNSKLNSISKPKPVTQKFKSESSPNLSASKKRFSHIKSTIPRPTPKKE